MKGSIYTCWTSLQPTYMANLIVTFTWNFWRASKSHRLLIERVRDERLRKDKVLSWITNWAPKRWDSCASRSLHSKSVKAFLHGQISSIVYSNGCRSLDVENDPFKPREEGEELPSPEVPYLNAIGALMYLANNTRPDISFFVNLLSRYRSSPTRRHWKRG